MDAKVFWRIRKLLEGLDPASVDGQIQPTVNPQLEVLVAQSAMVYTEQVRMGRAFFANTATAVPAVVAIPTTACMFAIYNNAADGGRSLVIDWVAAQNVASTAVANQAQLLALIGQVRETAPTDAALVIKKRNGFGQGTNDTNVRTILTATALPGTTGLATNWFPLGQSASKPGVTALPGYGVYQRVDGDIIVPPGRYFAMHVISSVVGETFQGFIGWHEKQLGLG